MFYRSISKRKPYKYRQIAIIRNTQICSPSDEVVRVLWICHFTASRYSSAERIEANKPKAIAWLKISVKCACVERRREFHSLESP